MGQRGAKAIVEGEEISKALSSYDLAAIQKQFRFLAKCANLQTGKIERQIFINEFLLPAFRPLATANSAAPSNSTATSAPSSTFSFPLPSPSSSASAAAAAAAPSAAASSSANPPSAVFQALVDRTFSVLDQNQNGFIEYEEFLVAAFLIKYSSREDKLKLLLAIFDSSGSGKIGKKDIKKMNQILCENSSGLSSSVLPADSQRELVSLYDAVVFFTLYNYDRDNDNALAYSEFRRLADEDEFLDTFVEKFHQSNSRQTKWCTIFQKEEKSAQEHYFGLFYNEKEEDRQKEKEKIDKKIESKKFEEEKSKNTTVNISSTATPTISARKPTASNSISSSSSASNSNKTN